MCHALTRTTLVTRPSRDVPEGASFMKSIISTMLPVQNPEDDDEVIEHTGTIIWKYYKSVGFRRKKGGAKNVICIFYMAFTGGSSSRALTHILGRQVLGQEKSNIKACVPIRKDDDNRYVQFKTAQKILNKEMVSKEAKLSKCMSCLFALSLCWLACVFCPIRRQCSSGSSGL
jgi:hypothetical protein